MNIHLGGHLNQYEPHKRSDLKISLTEPMPLVDLILRLRIPEGEIMLVVLNGELTNLGDTHVEDQDRLDLYPPLGGG